MSKTIIITGASRGIGKEMAKHLAKQGNRIIANYNKSEEKAKELQSELKKENIEIDIFKADVSKREECKKLVEYTIKKYKKIDVLINNAGISVWGPFTELTDEELHEIMNVNLYSAIAMTQETIKYMIKEQKGCIINISSIWGMVGASCEVAYSITKAGIDGLTKSLAKELGPSNIRVNSIAPGAIDTEMNADLTEEERKEIENETPLGKIGKTIDIAKTASWLIEDEFTTGQIISPNGGLTII
ncbi:MAG: 3-oxoacyl-ACP reductase FabG [Clostridia bacterium]|nr:3-oxoacyl-ACP reductase FabG [Clostridia bacterium]